jgi:uncharacterized protein YkwD
LGVRKECSHFAAWIATMIGSAALIFSPAAAQARSPRAAHACHAHHGHTHTCTTGAHGHHVRSHTPRTHHAQPKVRPQHVAAPRTKVRSEATGAAPSPSAQIAAALTAQCANTEIKPEPANVPAVRAAVLCLINRVRAEHGEAPLVTNADLERAAEEHSQELVADDYFAHVSPSGLTPVQRIEDTGYVPGPSFGYVLGENLAWGTLNLATPEQIVQAWVASPGHLANILESQYKDTGIGVTAAVCAGVRRRPRLSTPGGRRRRSLLWPDQRKEVVRTLSDSSCGTLEVTGR